LRTIQPKTNDTLCHAAIDVVDEESLNLLGHLLEACALSL
jgi:hypothetical protein